ncbi:PTS lactose/cellobiose transporter subunit IIA [Pectobacterium zantedeschiae]|uniref:PTS lactose/cellobiose transporter subunit IIA n=1 Tax=Pectobacterium zantedeschiae TaxID=2034769 RepID=A0A9X8JH43_9GAMM|nr:PTS lactose/cellobiose transporter subunit IIA [Pectobacterium zantedeschiae]RYC42803.1 PTS lactose/cellobiose transporter subunit IIA [Pectobacterium zantedeschiae]RYC43613.1 PTS lactose/cellobiose transporter subunit IIA [Pectobacterium zantedeschiae]RYC49165.1 PTS lactose/cellobiose transporter subunit IIA [Pectobacterium zantedeschiae]
MDVETRMIELIVKSGETRSCAMEALRSARRGEWDHVDELLKMAAVALSRAQLIQTGFIGYQSKEKTNLELIVVHAQDHLMNAMLCRELAEEIIELRKEVSGVNMHMR